MIEPAPVVFLLDVDNTLLDNDRIIADLNRYLVRALGAERQERYWKIFESRRRELGYADYLGALQRYRVENPGDPNYMQVSFYLLKYSFANRLYPGALDVIDHLGAWGPTVILSDGDVIFQPHKVRHSGLYEAVEGRVLIYIHKERQLDDVEKRYPARHYVLVDDKLRILTAMKKSWDSRLTTVFPHQGHYACDPKELAAYPPADITVEHIADLLQYDLPALLAAADQGNAQGAATSSKRKNVNVSREPEAVLVIDVGGTHVKILATGEKTRRKFVSGPTLTAEEMVAGVRQAAEGWKYQAVSIGYPGPVLHGKPLAEPHNLGSGWVGFDFEAAFGCPVKLVNDAAMQALGNYKGGKMLFLGLGTGLGSAMIVEGVVEPMELGHLPYEDGTYEDYVGLRGLERLGKKKWRRYVEDVVERLIAALEPDDVVLGGGNARKLKLMPPHCRQGDNAHAILGGFRLWSGVPGDEQKQNTISV
jgi:polyphosphate glucokinase